MARRASPQFDEKLPSELRATRGMLDQRWIELSRLLASTLGQPLDGRALRVGADYQANQAWAGLQGSACERVTRNYGGTTFVAPLCDIDGGLAAWLGWQEVWEVAAGTSPFRFRNAGLTIYLGKSSEAAKPQILRLEWPGISNWLGDKPTFQSPGAGHPHWQFDLMHSLAKAPSRGIFEPNVEEVFEDFESSINEPTTDEMLTRFSIERMHFASAAPWWLPRSAGKPAHHMNTPDDLEPFPPCLSRAG